MVDGFLIDVKKVGPMIKGSGPIVVVDDDDTQLDIVRICYRKSKRSNPLVCLSSGEELLDFVSDVRNQQETFPEMILLDINMPRIDGFKALEKVRSYDEFIELPPIVMCTSSERDADKIKAYNLKATAYFSKPINAMDYISFFQSI